MWTAVRQSFNTVCEWINIFLKELFLSTGKINGLLILSLIGIAVFVFLVSMKFINSIRR